MLSATVRNQGNGRSASTTLRYYHSLDATISTGDTQVGTGAVSGLAAAASSDQSISLTAPSSAGTYYYGACVDPVSENTLPGTTVPCRDSNCRFQYWRSMEPTQHRAVPWNVAVHVHQRSCRNYRHFQAELHH